MAENLGIGSYKLVLDTSKFSAMPTKKELAIIRAEMRATVTPTEKLQMTHEQMEKAFKAGAISADTYARHMGNYKKSVAEAAEAQKKKHQEMAAGAPIVGRYIGMIGRIHPAMIAAAAGTAGWAAASMLARRAISELTDVVTEQLKAVDDLAKQARAVGIDVQSLSELRFTVGETAGLDTGQTDKAIEQMQLKLSGAASGIGRGVAMTRKALAELQLDAGRLQAAGPSEAIRQIADSLKLVPLAADRARIATILFGDQGPKLATMLQGGREQIDALGKDYRALAGELSAAQALQVEAAQDAIGRVNDAFTGFKRQLAVEMAPGIEASAKAFTDILTDDDFRDAVADVTAMLTIMANLAPQAIESAVDSVGILAKIAQFKVDPAGAVGSWWNKDADEAAALSKRLEKQLIAANERRNRSDAADSAAAMAQQTQADIERLEAMEELAQAFRDQIELYGLDTNESKIYQARKEARTEADWAAVREAEKQLDILKGLDREKAALDAEQQRRDDEAAAFNDELARKQSDKLKQAQKDMEKLQADIASAEKAAQSRADSIREGLKTPGQKLADEVSEIADLQKSGFLDPQETMFALAKLRDEAAKPIKAGKVDFGVDAIEAGSSEGILKFWEAASKGSGAAGPTKDDAMAKALDSIAKLMQQLVQLQINQAGKTIPIKFAEPVAA